MMFLNVWLDKVGLNPDSMCVWDGSNSGGMSDQTEHRSLKQRNFK